MVAAVGGANSDSYERKVAMYIRLSAIAGLLSVACPTYAQSYFDSNPYDRPTFDRDTFSDYQQHGSDPSGHGHAHDGHDQGQAHAQPRSPVTPPGDTGRLRELPSTGRFGPPAQAPLPSDRDRLTPPSLPRGAQSGQTESPLGDGPPPPTVPLSAPRRPRVPESESLNI